MEACGLNETIESQLFKAKLKNEVHEIGKGENIDIERVLFEIEHQDSLREVIQKLNEAQDALSTIIPPELMEFPNNIGLLNFDDQLNYIINELKLRYQEEEKNFINNSLPSEAIVNGQLTKLNTCCKKDDSVEIKRVESYKKSRLNEKIRHIRKKLREQFITDKMKKTKIIVKQISDVISRCERKIVGPAYSQSLLKNRDLDGFKRDQINNQKSLIQASGIRLNSGSSGSFDGLQLAKEDLTQTRNIQKRSRGQETNILYEHCQQFFTSEEPMDLRSNLTKAKRFKNF